MAFVFGSALLPWVAFIALGVWTGGRWGAFAGLIAAVPVSAALGLYAAHLTETERGRPRRPVLVKRQMEELTAALGLRASPDLPGVWRTIGRRGALPWAIDLTPAGGDTELLSGQWEFTPAERPSSVPAIPTHGTMRRVNDVIYALMCTWLVTVRVGQPGERSAAQGPLQTTDSMNIERFRPSLERAGLWADMQRLSQDQAPFDLMLQIEDGVVVAVLPLTNRLDPSMVERTVAALARWRASMLEEEPLPATGGP